jgi:hypothetical protein
LDDTSAGQGAADEGQENGGDDAVPEKDQISIEQEEADNKRLKEVYVR